MKKIKKLPFIIFIALTAFFAVGVILISGGNSASANERANNDTYISCYSVLYEIGSDRKIGITEDITVNFRNRSGVYKYIPFNAGEQVRDLKVCELKNGAEKEVYYDVSIENQTVYLDIGDYNVKNGEYTYRISYDYCLTKAQEGKNVLALTPIGADWPCRIENVNIKMILPDGYIKDSALCFVNRFYEIYDKEYERTDIEYETSLSDGKTVLTAHIDLLEKGSEVRFDMSFNEGALSLYSDASAYLYLIPSIAGIALVIILKLFVFNKNHLTPVVNYEAPNRMDPLLMGKLIDGTVDDEDVTSLIYYWASLGYIKINLDDRNDPTIIRIVQNLPDSSPEHEKIMFHGLFSYGDTVKPSQLKNSFYRVVGKVKSTVNENTRGLHDKKSIIIACILTALGGIMLGLVPMITALTKITSKLLYLPAFFMLVPVFLLNIFAISIKYNSLKIKKRNTVLAGLGIALACLIVGAAYVFLLPSCILDVWQKTALFVACCPLFTLPILLITRKKEYVAKLNDIVGFKNFITLAEKDQLEIMLEEDPQFYYRILPYAQVLGVTNIWADKFKSLTVEPPQWLTGNFVTTYMEFRIMNEVISGSMKNISSGMSRPSQSGMSGGRHGGSFGGFSGGGHGGGGGGFR